MGVALPLDASGAPGKAARSCLDSLPGRGGIMDRDSAVRGSRVETAEAVAGSKVSQQAVISRRAAIGGAFGGAVVTLLARPELAAAQDRPSDHPCLGLLLRGRYKPVVHGPDLGLSMIDLNDGSYSKTKIYPAFGVPGHRDVLKPIGTFYVQFTGSLCAYDLPGGAIAMRFTSHSNTVSVSDGSGGAYVEGSFELRIPEATGDYHSFVGGHNHMVDDLHLLADGNADEFCVCLISRPEN